MNQRRTALATLLIALILDLLLGALYGLAEHISISRGIYCGIGNAVTEGACTAPQTGTGEWINVGEFLTVVPLFAATFSLLTSALTTVHVGRSHNELRRRLDHIISHHPDIPSLQDDAGP